MSGLTVLPPYPDSASRADFITKGDSYVATLDDFAASWTAFANRGISNDILISTSTTSLTIDATQKTLVLDTDKPCLPGQYIMLTTGSSSYIYGTVNGYNPVTKTLIIDVLLISGSGSAASWNIHNCAARGAIGKSNSWVEVRGLGALGLVNTRIITYSTLVEDVGPAITPDSNANDGASFTINQAGPYFVSIGMALQLPSALFGISKNSTQLSTDLGSISPQSGRIIIARRPAAGTITQISTVAYLAAGDVLRPHVSSAGSGAGTANESVIIRSLGF